MSKPRIRGALAGLALSMLMPSLDTSIANTALPALAAAFNAPFQQVQWIVLAYLLALTTVIVSVGRLGDIVGRRRLLLAGIVLFTGASLGCGAATTLPMLLVSRAAQGVGAAVMMALAVAMVGDTVPGARTGTAMGLLGTVSAIGTTLGPGLGGGLIAASGWRAIFLVNVPVGVTAFVLAHRYLPADRPSPAPTASRFDPVGTVVLALTLAVYALAMTIGRGHGGLLNLALLSASVCGAVVFIVVEAHAASPLIRLGRLGDPELRARLATSALVSTVMMATLVVGPFYLSRALKLSPAVVGAVLSAGPLVAALAGLPAGRVVDRVGARSLTTLGLAGIAIGAGGLAALPASLGLVGYVLPLVLMTGSYALFQAANNTAVMTGIGPDERGVVASLVNLARNLGLITGASAMGSLFAHGVGSIEPAAADPDAVAAGMRITFGIAMVLIVAAVAIGGLTRSGRARMHPDGSVPPGARAARQWRG